MATDKTFYRWARDNPRGLLTLAGLDTSPEYEFEAPSTKIEIDGRFDAVLKPGEPTEPLVFAEFVGYPDDKLLWRWPLKILSRYGEMDHPGPVEAVVVYLRRSYRCGTGQLTLGSSEHTP
jgi:hypothetical protein